MQVNLNGMAPKSMEERLAMIGSRIDALMTRLHEFGADPGQHVHDLMQDLYSSVDRELKRIEKRIQSTSNRIDDDVTKTRADFLDSVREELAVWRGRIEGLRLEATLGRMELDDRMEPKFTRLEVLYEKARWYLHELARDEMAWDELEPGLSEAMADLRREVDIAGTEHFFG